MKLAIGTAQFGLDYGVANVRGQIPPEETAAIVRAAEHYGLRTLDTAAGYGSSEQCLGDIGVAGWEVVTKIPECPDERDPQLWVGESVRAALGRLRIPRLYGLLLHRPSELLGRRGQALYDALVAVREAGLIGKIGCSVYQPEELQAMSHVQFDLVQLPCNVFDDRFARSGWLSRLADNGVEVHARSVFLQGVLLMPSQERPVFFERWASRWHAYHAWLAEIHLSPLEACLRAAAAVPEIRKLVVGLDGLHHLHEIVRALDGPAPVVPPHVRSDDTELLNPVHWIGKV